MEHMDTMADAIRELERDGYSAQFSIDPDGWITDTEGRWSAADVTVERTVRFEGLSNPDDASMLLAIRAGESLRGTLVLPYGPDLSGDQADTVRTLAAGSDD